MSGQMQYFELYGLQYNLFPKNALENHQTFESCDFYNATGQLSNRLIVIIVTHDLDKSTAIDRFLLSLDAQK